MQSGGKIVNDYKVNTNLNKSEIVAYGVKKKPVITIKGCALKCSTSYKYLGYMQQRLRSKAHLTERKEKMKRALNFFLVILGSLNRIQIKNKKSIAKACIETVGLYGTEVMIDICDKRISEGMELVQRNFARRRLRTSRNVANGTLLRDLN